MLQQSTNKKKNEYSVQNDRSHCAGTLQSLEGQWKEVGHQTCSEDL